MKADARLHLRLGKPLLRRLKAMAKEEKKTVSELAVHQLECMVNDHEVRKSLKQDAEQI